MLDINALNPTFFWAMCGPSNQWPIDLTGGVWKDRDCTYCMGCEL